MWRSRVDLELGTLGGPLRVAAPRRPLHLPDQVPGSRSDHPVHSWRPSSADHLPRAGTTRWCPTLARSMRAKRWSMKRYIALLLAGLLVSCGGGGDGASSG